MTACRPTRTIGGDAIVLSAIGAECIRRADSNNRRLVTGRMNAAVDLSAVCILSIVSRRGDYNNSGIDQRAGRATNRIVLVRADGGSAQAHIHDADVVLDSIERVRRADGLCWIGRA